MLPSHHETTQAFMDELCEWFCEDISPIAGGGNFLDNQLLAND
jgi:hypothetical protein